MMPCFIVIFLLVCLALTAVSILRTNDLAMCTIFGCVFSFLSAMLYLVLNAPDVAMTEAAVGSGVSTVFALGALSQIKNRFALSSPVNFHIIGLFLAFGCLIALALITLPTFGNSTNPAHALVAYYTQHSSKSIGVSNIVTAILASFRGYDTFGETLVIFIAGSGVFCILKNDDCDKSENE